jgi:hypothetical protein
MDGPVAAVLLWEQQACGLAEPGYLVHEGTGMATEWQDKMRSIGFLSGGRTGDRERSGREHPDSGRPWKSVTDEAGNTVTEHSDPGSGVSCRQDVEIRPATVRAPSAAGQP